MSESLTKQDLKEVFTESLEPFSDAIKKDFDRMDEKLTEIKTDVGINKVNIQEGFKEAKIERAELKTRVNDTYNAVDGFVKVVDKLDQEFSFMKEDMRRNKEVIKEKLGVDLT